MSAEDILVGVDHRADGDRKGEENPHATGQCASQSDQAPGNDFAQRGHDVAGRGGEQADIVEQRDDELEAVACGHAGTDLVPGLVTMAAQEWWYGLRGAASRFDEQVGGEVAATLARLEAV